MYLGKLVEEVNVEVLVDAPLHPYTQALFVAIPDPKPSVKKNRAIIKGEVSNPIHLPSGCRFHNRCPKMQEICTKEEPILKDRGNGRRVACHFAYF